MAENQSKFKKFDYLQKKVVNIVFKSNFHDNVINFLDFVRSQDYKIIEVSDNLFNIYKKDMFCKDSNHFLNYDITYIDVSKFGSIKTTLFLVGLEQTLYDKMIILFSTDPFEKCRLIHMTQVTYDPFIRAKNKFFAPVIDPFKEFYSSAIIKIKELNKLLDKYDEYNAQIKGVKLEKKKNEKLLERPINTETPSLKNNVCNLFFMFFFTSLAILSGFFAFSGTRKQIYKSTISSAVATMKNDSVYDVFQAERLNLANYNQLLTVYNIEKNWEGDFVSVLTFDSTFRETQSGTNFMPLLFPGDGLDSFNYTKLGYNLLSTGSIENTDNQYIPALVPGNLVKSIFSLTSDEKIESYIGKTFDTIYNFKNIKFQINSIIVNDGNYNLNGYSEHTIILFDKPSIIDDKSFKLKTFIKSDSSSINAYLSHFYNYYDADDMHEFSYLNKQGQLISETFVLNDILYQLSFRNETYIVEVVFCLLSYILIAFAFTVVYKMRKIYQFDIKKLSIISAIVLFSIFLVYFSLNIYQTLSRFSPVSVAMMNPFGVVFSLVSFVIIELFLWYPLLLASFNRVRKPK